MKSLAASPCPWIRHDRGGGVAWAVVGLAAVLRLATLGTWPLWIDEAFTLHDAHDVVPSYPLGYWITAASARLLGDSEFALRLVPCLCGVGTVLLLATWRTAGVAPRQRALAGLLLALSSWHLFWSQSVRYYAPMGLLLVAAARALDSPSPGPRRGALAALAMVLAVLFHPTAAFFLPGALLFVLARRQGTAGRPGLPRHLGWLLVALAAAGALALSRYGWLVDIHLRYKGPGSPWQFASSFGFQAGPLLLAAAAWGLWITLREALRSGGRPGAALSPEVCFGVVPLGLLFGTSFVLFVTGYHAIGTLPFLALLAARAARAPAVGGGRLRAAAVGGALVAEQLAGLGLYHGSHGMRPRHREAAAIVSADPGATVYATREEPLAYYLSEGKRVLRDPPEARPLEAGVLDELAHAVASSELTWAVIHPDDLRAWGDDDLARLGALLGDAEPVALPNRFGPKELTLRLHRIERPVDGEVAR